VPAAGVAIALVMLALPRGFLVPALPYAAGAAAVIVLLGSLHTLAATHAARLALFLVGWGAHAAAAMYESLAAPPAQHEWLTRFAAGAGIAVFAASVGLIVVGVLRAEARQRGRAERNALDAARKYRHVYYTAPVALISIDLLGQVLRWNDQAAQLFRGQLKVPRRSSPRRARAGGTAPRSRCGSKRPTGGCAPARSMRCWPPTRSRSRWST